MLDVVCNLDPHLFREKRLGQCQTFTRYFGEVNLLGIRNKLFVLEVDSVDLVIDFERQVAR